jgi:hypothetical protein
MSFFSRADLLALTLLQFKRAIFAVQVCREKAITYKVAKTKR